nr:unnamed protein product [Callosobruchus analis]
MKVRTGKPW